MVYVLNTTGKLIPADVTTILDLTIQGKEIISDKEYDDIILYTKRDVIKAKTPTQKFTLKVLRKTISALQLVLPVRVKLIWLLPLR